MKMPSRTTLTMGSAEASIGFTRAIEFLMSVIICSGMCSYNVSHASEFDTDGGIELIDKPPVVCQGHYEYHLQGITGNRKDMLYWSYTTMLVKTDLTGKVLVKKKVKSHHGDLCYANGRLYVAFHKPGQIRIYDSDDLSFIESINIEDKMGGAVSGIEYHNGHFIIVGKVEGTHNYLYEYDSNFKYLETHILKFPSWGSKYGFQTICHNDGYWWISSYGKTAPLLKTDELFNVLGKYNFYAAVGIVGWGRGGYLVARHFGKNVNGEWQAKALWARSEPAITVSGTVPRESGDLPSSYDRSEDDAFPPIGRQYRSSCTGWGCTYYSATYVTAKLRNWNAKTGGEQYRCSPYWTLNLVKDGRRGEKDIAYWHSGVQVKHGCAMLSDFPQGEPNFQKSWCTDPAVWRKAISYRMKSRKILKNINTPSGLRALKEHILDDRYGIATAGDSPSRGAWVTTIIKDDPSTSEDDAFVGQSACYHVLKKPSGHTMAIVGYNDNIWIDVNGNGKIDDGEKGVLKIAESHGARRGNNGFYWLAYDALNSKSGVSGGPNPSDRIEAFDQHRIFCVKGRDSIYKPKLLAEFTLKTAARSDVCLTFHRTSVNDAPPFSKPQASWQGDVFSDLSTGKSKFRRLAFDGNDYSSDPDEAPEGTFVFDLTDIAPPVGEKDSKWRYVLELKDTRDGMPVTVSSFKVIDPTRGDAESVAGNTPVTVDNNKDYVWADYPDNTITINDQTQTLIPAGDIAIIDDFDTGFTVTGIWNESGETSAESSEYNGYSLYTIREGATAKWVPYLAQSGNYKVYAWWKTFGTRAVSAPYKVTHKNGINTVRVNQQENGEKWNLLGSYEFNAGAGGNVMLTREADEKSTSADAVKFEYTGPSASLTPTPTPRVKPIPIGNIVIVDNRGPGFTTRGEWKFSSAPNGYMGSSHWSGKAGSTVKWVPELPKTGRYKVYARWTIIGTRAENAPYKITHKNGNDTVRVNQQENGGKWNLLGTYKFNAGTGGNVMLTREAGKKNISADAIKFEFIEP